MADGRRDGKLVVPEIAVSSRQMPPDPRTAPTGVRAPHGARVLEITWADGVKYAYPHDILRGYCPCAGCQGHSGTIRFVSGGDLELREIEQVGNYALSFTWGDGHSSGIYTFRYLRGLGELVAEHGAEAVKAMGEVPQA
jgi:DUF971 family protein